MFDGWEAYNPSRSGSPPTRIIGPSGLGIANGIIPNWLPAYRHDLYSSASPGLANMVYVDGHAGAIKPNGYHIYNVYPVLPWPSAYTMSE